MSFFKKDRYDTPKQVMIRVITPRDQAAKCIESQKPFLLTDAKRIVDQKQISDHEFHWIMEIHSENELRSITKKCAMGEFLIKKFYRMIFKLIKKTNKWGAKGNKKLGKMKDYLLKLLKKSSPDGNLSNIPIDLDAMVKENPDGSFIEITDQEEIEKMLDGDLISVELLESVNEEICNAGNREED